MCEKENERASEGNGKGFERTSPSKTIRCLMISEQAVCLCVFVCVCACECSCACVCVCVC